MTVNDTLAAIEVMKAFTEGKTLEYRPKPGGVETGSDPAWKPFPSAVGPSWDWSRCQYRVKVEPPKPQEYWAAVNRKGSNHYPPTFPSREEAERYIHKAKDTWKVVRLVEVPS